MAYNTRRSVGRGVEWVGQRRPQVNTFVPGGMLNNAGGVGGREQQYDGVFQSPGNQFQKQPQQQKPGGQMNQPKPHAQGGPNQQQQQNQQNPQQQPQQQRPNLTANAQMIVNKMKNEQVPNTQVPPPPLPDSETQMDTTQTDSAVKSGATGKEKPFWMKKAVKIPRAEKIRRRNKRLSKMLHPKNALMVLNELVGSTAYTITDSKTGYNQDLFKAVLTIDSQSFTGFGKSKVAAKTDAAESAIKAILLSRIRTPGDLTQTKIKTEEAATAAAAAAKDDSQEDEDISWSHIAGYAIYKLLSGWEEEEGNNLVNLYTSLNSSGAAASIEGAPKPPSLSGQATVEMRPAKKLPENAPYLNPAMLLNQMFPQTKYEEVSRQGTPPNIQFTMTCDVDGKVYTGTGQNKKLAKMLAAREACKELLGIEYPPEVVAGEKAGSETGAAMEVTN